MIFMSFLAVAAMIAERGLTLFLSRQVPQEGPFTFFLSVQSTSHLFPPPPPSRFLRNWVIALQAQLRRGEGPANIEGSRPFLSVRTALEKKEKRPFFILFLSHGSERRGGKGKSDLPRVISEIQRRIDEGVRKDKRGARWIFYSLGVRPRTHWGIRGRFFVSLTHTAPARPRRN